MKLGGHEFAFEDGQWVVGEFFCLIYRLYYLRFLFGSGISGAGWAQRTGPTTEAISKNSGGEQPTQVCCSTVTHTKEKGTRAKKPFDV